MGVIANRCWPGRLACGPVAWAAHRQARARVCARQYHCGESRRGRLSTCIWHGADQPRTPARGRLTKWCLGSSRDAAEEVCWWCSRGADLEEGLSSPHDVTWQVTAGCRRYSPVLQSQSNFSPVPPRDTSPLKLCGGGKPPLVLLPPGRPPAATPLENSRPASDRHPREECHERDEWQGATPAEAEKVNIL